jgi:Ni/Co efflux regulator RcnB
MKKILSLMLGMSFVFGTLAFAQDASKDSTTTDSTKTTKKHKKSKKSKGDDKMASPDSTTAPKQ